MTAALSAMKKMISQTASTTAPPSLSPSSTQLPDRSIPAKDLKALAAWATSEFDKMKTGRQSIQRRWYLNLAMYMGKQYMEQFIDSVGGKLDTPRAPAHRVRTTVNLIEPLVRTEISRMTSQKPSATFIPGSSEDDDLMAASAAEQLWESIQNQNKYNAAMIRTAFWTSITGNGFVKTYWDNNKLDRANINPITKMPMQGAVCHDVVTPFHLFVPDHLIEEIEDQPYVFEAYTRPIAWIKKYLGDKLDGKDITLDSVSKQTLFESRYMEVEGGNDAKPDSVLFIEAWIKPGGHELLPNGGMLTIVNGNIISSVNGMPYNHGEYPYAHQKHVPTGGFYARSVLESVGPLQKEYNRTRSHIIESKNKMARPQLLVPQGSMDVSKYTSAPGLLIPYNPAFQPPTPLPMQSLPSYVLEEQDRIKGDIEDISGQHQASKGMAPGGGVEAATAIAYLQEKDDSLMATTFSSIEAVCEKNARQTISLVVDYWDLPRMVRIVGSDSSFDALELKGSQIGNSVDIRAEGGSALPQSRPAKQAFLMDMAKMGFISPEQLFDMLDIGGVEKIRERIRIDMNAATRENQKMKRLNDEQFMEHQNQIYQELQTGENGQQDPQTGQWMFTADPDTWPPIVPVNDWDNHAVHIATHNNYRKGQEFETLPQNIKDEFHKHVQYHQAALSATVQPGMMDPSGGGAPQQGATPGQPGAPTDPSAAPQPGTDPNQPSMPQ